MYVLHIRVPRIMTVNVTSVREVLCLPIYLLLNTLLLLLGLDRSRTL